MTEFLEQKKRQERPTSGMMAVGEKERMPARATICPGERRK